MPDFIYLLITVASFAALARLVGFLDHRLAADDAEDEPAEEPVATSEVPIP